MIKSEDEMSLEEAQNLVKVLRDNICESVFGQDDLIDEALSCLIAGGHILMTGAPGLAKTTLVRVIANKLGMHFSRIQFTPDLLPTDIIGAEILNMDSLSGRRHFEFSKGPIFANLVLADEINRASPRTQSALLEAMQERSCTVAGTSYPLPAPFMVFATQNPFESEGTFPLPEAQMDRFLVHSLVGYPSKDAENRILTEHSERRLVGEIAGGSLAEENEQIKISSVSALIRRCSHINVGSEIIEGINALVRSTRPQDELCPEPLKNSLWYGAGPRAGISLISVCRAYALLTGSETVRWAHVVRFAKPVLRHRIRLTVQATRDHLTEENIVDQLIDQLERNQHNLAKGIR